MNKFYLGLGSNLGDRRAVLEEALRKIEAISRIEKIASIYETPALIPKKAKPDWNRAFLNGAVEITTSDSPQILLEKLLAIERSLGRKRLAKWSPRTLDIDILHGINLQTSQAWELATESLTLPHPEIFNREFVMDPLSEIAPDLTVNGRSVLRDALAHAKHQTKLMGVVNVTPDSFSDGGKFFSESAWVETLQQWDKIGIAAIDVGGESTRPQASLLDEDSEWARLEPMLRFLESHYRGNILRPKISVDTRYALTAKRAIQSGAQIINDVSGLSDPEMISVLRSSSANLVLMHSLSVPPTRENVIPQDTDPVSEIREWFEQKLRMLEASGIARSRVWLDPGIGFGKTALQSLVVLRGIDEFKSLGARILVGHSRKSFMKDWTDVKAADRDAETLGLSFELQRRGVDFLRVHDPVFHHRAFLAARQIA